MKTAISTVINVKTTFEALHCWRNIPEQHPSQFLKTPHRHVFHFFFMFKVGHDDRDLEFFEIKSKIDKVLKEMFPKKENELLPDIGSMSCEMLAERLLNLFSTLDCMLVKVSEDGENGAISTYNQIFLEKALQEVQD
jgi:hypothetical protein